MNLNDVSPLIWILTLGIAICTRMVFDLIVFVYRCATVSDNYIEQKKHDTDRMKTHYSLLISFLFVAMYLCILLIIAFINPKLQ